jgi:hypothetical protein
MISVPMMIERRRPAVSATTPVGISNTRMLASMIVPRRTSWSGPRWATLMR